MNENEIYLTETLSNTIPAFKLLGEVICKGERYFKETNDSKDIKSILNSLRTRINIELHGQQTDKWQQGFPVHWIIKEL